MNISEKNRLKENIIKLKNRLNELRNRYIEIDPAWKFIYESVFTVHESFKKIIDALIKQCEVFLKEIDYSSRSYEIFHELINLLYIEVDYLRKDFFDLFPKTFTNRLYLYLFMRELLLTFPPSTKVSERLKYIMIPTGYIGTWPIHKTLVGRAHSWVDFEIQKDIEEIKENEVIGFECDPEESLDRWIIEGHEIFHVLIDKTPRIKEQLTKIENRYKQEFGGLFFHDQPETMHYIKELFCDFGATWHFGPAYGKAFIDEIVFSTSKATKTHPQRVIRVMVIRSALQGIPHPYREEINKFYKTYRHEVAGIQSQGIEFLRKEFISMVKSCDISQYKPQQIKDRIKKHFEHNLPYLYQDIREFLNNLPKENELEKDTQRHFKNLILESLRKNILYHQFTEHIREPSRMFPLPKAF